AGGDDSRLSHFSYNSFQSAGSGAELSFPGLSSRTELQLSPLATKQLVGLPNRLLLIELLTGPGPLNKSENYAQIAASASVKSDKVPFRVFALVSEFHDFFFRSRLALSCAPSNRWYASADRTTTAALPLIVSTTGWPVSLSRFK